MTPLALEGWLYLARPVLALLVALFAWALWRAHRRDAAEGVRGTERAFLLLAAIAVGAETVVLYLADPYHHSPSPLKVEAILLGAFAFTHALLSWRRRHADPLLLPAAALLVGLGWLEVYRLSPALALRQSAWVVISVACLQLWFVVVRDYRRLEDYKYVMVAAGVALQLMVMIFGTEVNGARLWMRFHGFSFQPVEIVKVLLILFLAAYLRQNRAFLHTLWRDGERGMIARYLAPLVLMAAAAEFVFVKQRDLGQGLLFFGVFITMLFCATRRARLAVWACGLFAAMSALCYQTFPHVRVRFAAWIDPWQTAHGGGFQMVQALYAQAAGGWLGTGLWRGQPWRVPEAATDFIYVSLLEEMGVVIGLAIIACFGVIVARCFVIARRSRDDFGALLACGIGATFGVQAFVIIAGTIKLIPMTGITLPFMSYGGSSLVANFIMLAMLLQISNDSSPDGGADRQRSAPAGWGFGFIEKGYALLLMLPAIWLVYFLLGPGVNAANDPDNPRTAEDLRARGRIVDRRDRPLARTEVGTVPLSPRLPLYKGAPWDRDSADVRRVYESGAAWGNLLGYRSVVLNSSGLELTYDKALRGHVEPRSLLEAWRQARGADPRGRDLVLTIDEDLQELAYAQLADHRGAALLLDPRNGDILALASAPGFDANTVEREWQHLLANTAAPLVCRGLDAAFAPGSTFKPFIAATALTDGAVSVNDVFECTGSYDVDGFVLHDAEPGGHGIVNVENALVDSCNVAFAQIGLKLGADRLETALEQTGFTSMPWCGLPADDAHFPNRRDLTPPQVAQTAFGQGSLALSPLQVAMLTAGIADSGQIMRPRLVRAVRVAGAPPVPRPLPAPANPLPVIAWRRIASPAAAAAVTTMMEAAVARGTGTAAQIAGTLVAGKTGTAENPQGVPNAWFAAFAPADAPRCVAVVLLENSGFGGTAAAPVVRTLLLAALRR